MSKVILLDIDGVIIRPRHKYFSEKYSQEHNIPLSDILPFFKGEYKKAARGEVDIREVLPPYLSRWAWQGNLDDFLSYWFEGERTVDVNVLETVKKLREGGNKVYLVSDNEKERADYIMNKVGLKNDFDGAFFSYQFGLTKGDPELFQIISQKLKLKPEDIEYWDDDPKNVEVAKSVGINAKTYKSFEEFEKSIL